METHPGKHDMFFYKEWEFKNDDSFKHARVRLAKRQRVWLLSRKDYSPSPVAKHYLDVGVDRVCVVIVICVSSWYNKHTHKYTYTHTSTYTTTHTQTYERCREIKD